MSLYVLEFFLGSAWVAKHLVSEVSPFFQGYQNPTIGDSVGARRVWELADMLLNLQHVGGFEEPLRKLQEDSVETGFAAFEAAKLLRRSGTPFNFVTRVFTSGKDFDIEAFPEGARAVAIEAKCKISPAKMRRRTITDALTRARGQLPEEKPGLIMLRVPWRWAAKETRLQGPFAQAARSVLRNSEHLAGILIFSNQFVRPLNSFGTSDREVSMIVVQEFWSENTKFADAADWHLCRSRIFDEASWTSIARLIGETWLSSPTLPSSN